MYVPDPIQPNLVGTMLDTLNSPCVLQPRPDQVVPGSKDIKVFCSESPDEFLSWYAGIRLAMNGQKLYDNYYNAHVKQFRLEDAESNMSQAEEKATLLTGRRLDKQLDKKREHYIVS